jgi:uncharacterized phage-like protein YoqJ
MVELEDRTRCACFTGHRPEKLERSEAEIVARLQKEIRQAIADGFQTFISGMAQGVDIWAAEIVLALRDEGTAIHLVCASPHEGFEKRWSQEWKERYQRVMAQADSVQFICNHYSRGCFQLRNKWMVDRSARVIAVYNGGPGGTRNTVEYAMRHSVPVIYVPLESNSDILIK